MVSSVLLTKLFFVTWTLFTTNCQLQNNELFVIKEELQILAFKSLQWLCKHLNFKSNIPKPASAKAMHLSTATSVQVIYITSSSRGNFLKAGQSDLKVLFRKAYSILYNII